MSTSKSFGSRAGATTGKALGKTAGFAWVGVCRVASGVGDFGESFIEATPAAFDAVLDAEERRKALKAKLLAEMAQQAAVVMTPVTA